MRSAALLFALWLLAAVAAGAFVQATGIFDLSGWAWQQITSVPGIEQVITTYRRGLESERYLDHERAALAAVQAELEKGLLALEAERARLERLERELTQRAAQLDRLQRELERQARALAEERKAAYDLARLQEVYAAMRPRELAPILAELDDEKVVLLLSGLDERGLAGVLAALPPERAARLSERISGIDRY